MCFGCFSIVCDFLFHFVPKFASFHVVILFGHSPFQSLEQGPSVPHEQV